MSDTAEIQLQRTLEQALKTNGIIDRIKAELRAVIFHALEVDGNFLDNLPLANKELSEFQSTPDGKKVASLVYEFLRFFKMDFTLSVFECELSESKSLLTRDQLKNEFKLSRVQTDSPILTYIVKDYISLTTSSDFPKSRLQDTHKPNLCNNEAVDVGYHNKYRSKSNNFDAKMSLLVPIFNDQNPVNSTLIEDVDYDWENPIENRLSPIRKVVHPTTNSLKVDEYDDYDYLKKLLNKAGMENETTDLYIYEFDPGNENRKPRKHGRSPESFDKNIEFNETFTIQDSVSPRTSLSSKDHENDLYSGKISTAPIDSLNTYITDSLKEIPKTKNPFSITDKEHRKSSVCKLPSIYIKQTQ